MLGLKEIKKCLFEKKTDQKRETEATLAYDLWSKNYDNQPDNLMLVLDEEIFTVLLNSIDIENKIVVDIGCGTGRHWEKLLDKKPDKLIGLDISEGMLNKLRQKFPEAITYKISDNLLLDIPESSIDLIISTLTIAHLENLEETLNTWFRILKRSGDIIITDYHPLALAKGGKRTFEKDKIQIIIKNFIHPIESIKQISNKNGGILVNTLEIKICEQHKQFYENKSAIHIFEKFRGTPIIYGLHIKKDNGIN
jgi:ubiquinone/menaquinone biosynthesis C-methylase UbiE